MTNTLAVIVGKLSAKAIRTIGAGLGSNVPGRVARAISPAVLTALAKQARLGVLAVSGTNGKSTTSGFVSSILRQANLKVAHNKQGANLVPGITASLIEASNWAGKLDIDYCLFEIDEGALPTVAKEVRIANIVVTNLFRDQLDRFGELDTTAQLINQGIQAQKSLAILNLDDPNVAKLGQGSQHLYYGIESLSGNTPFLARKPDMDSSVDSASANRAIVKQTDALSLKELSYCPVCGSEFAYSQIFYGQLGHYKCTSCNHARPTPDVTAANVIITAAGSTFDLTFGAHSFNVSIPLPGLFNVYNALAAAALGFSLNLPPRVIESGLRQYTTLFGRSEKLTIAGKQVLIQLIKNPAGATQAIKAVASDEGARILIAINDNYADGRDVSWLWDADFELLQAHGKSIITAGTRAYDMAVRLKYCGITSDRIHVIPSLAEALAAGLEATTQDETLWILPTYTCLLSLQKIAKSYGKALSGT